VANLTTYSPNRGFTLAEDAALKRRLSALAVSDDRDAERVAQVFYRYPEGETEKLYPFITIDLVDIAFDPERALSEVDYYFADQNSTSINQRANINYYPSEFAATELQAQVSPDTYMRTDQFVPVNLIYQITTHCRSQRHDRQLTMLFLRRVFPMRRGFIDVPEDGTIRRCDLLDWQESDLMDQETGYKKRIFRKLLTVRINAEIPQSDFIDVQRVLEVDGTLTNYDPATPDLSYPLMEDF
jgi:hypothetical protein